uniref:Uncharacterized protein n=1 Tax=Lepeophtheirus salmonis TaxID=72036 RepID=A0A0K2V5X1_LEPSM
MTTIFFQQILQTILEALEYLHEVVLGYCRPGLVDKVFQVLNIWMAHFKGLTLNVPPYRVIKRIEISAVWWPSALVPEWHVVGGFSMFFRWSSVRKGCS